MTRSGDGRGRESGLTLIEVGVIVAVVGVLVTIGMPMMRCAFEKGKMAEVMTDMRVSRDRVELFEMESGYFPHSLAEAFHPLGAPDTLCYCAEEPPDPNKGHGNERCLFFDPDNPSEPLPPAGGPGLKYLLSTKRSVAPGCSNMDFAFLGCCGSEPRVVNNGEVIKMPGHPGHGVRKCMVGTGSV